MRACARTGAHMIKFEKYKLSAFTGKELINLDKKERSYKKNENVHEIRKKRPGLCPAVIAQIEVRLAKILQNWRSTS